MLQRRTWMRLTGVLVAAVFLAAPLPAALAADGKASPEQTTDRPARVHQAAFFGAGGYVFLPSAEVLARGERRSFYHRAEYSATELDVTLQTAGLSVGVYPGVEAGFSFRSATLDSPESLGTGKATTHFTGDEATVFARYTPFFNRYRDRQYVDSAVTFGLSVTVLSMDGMSTPLQNIFESIHEELGQKDGQPTFYLTYGGFRRGGGPATSLYLKLGDSLSLGLGFRSRIMGGRLELSGEYCGTIYNVDESLLDRTQISFAVRKPVMGGRAAIKLGLSRLDMSLAGTGGAAEIRTTLDAYLLGVEYGF